MIPPEEGEDRLGNQLGLDSGAGDAKDAWNAVCAMVELQGYLAQTEPPPLPQEQAYGPRYRPTAG